ncbi:MAG: DUF2971 domain-containing protein [Erythrobacter sp.]|nr:DUF2971 domain-containing protein [Erythrobacter sp.]
MRETLEQEVDILYHYCSSSTFLSIVRNKKIWLTNLTLSNDRMEGLWAVKMFLDLFKNDDRNASFAAKTILEGEIRQRIALGTCFSSKGDLLSQWRGYAEGGRGVCIGFKKEALDRLELKSKSGEGSSTLRKINYCSFLPSEMEESIYAEFDDQIEQGRKCIGDNVSFSKDYSNDGHDRVTALINNLFTLKNPAFQEENEWRLLLVDYPSSIENIGFRESNSLLSPYVEVPFDADLISTICLGPLHPTPPSDIERLLKVYGIDARVKRSSASYVVR